MKDRVVVAMETLEFKARCSGSRFHQKIPGLLLFQTEESLQKRRFFLLQTFPVWFSEGF